MIIHDVKCHSSLISSTDL